MTMDGEILPKVGQMVFTSDGFLLGRVQEVKETSFKVDVALAPDVWLAKTTVAREDQAQDLLHLNISSLRIGQVRLRDSA